MAVHAWVVLLQVWVQYSTIGLMNLTDWVRTELDWIMVLIHLAVGAVSLALMTISSEHRFYGKVHTYRCLDFQVLAPQAMDIFKQCFANSLDIAAGRL
jgi:hypothetical protein